MSIARTPPNMLDHMESAKTPISTYGSDSQLNVGDHNVTNRLKRRLLDDGDSYLELKRAWDDSNEGFGKQLNAFREEMTQIFSHFTANQSNELQKVFASLKEIKQSNNNIENSIAYLTAQNEELNKKIVSLETQAGEDKKYITVLEHKIEEMQIGTRKTNFVIKNVAKKKQETKEELIEMVKCLSQTLNCKITVQDIKDIYRVRGRKIESQNSPIIVETGSTIVKNEVLKTAKTFNVAHKSKLCCRHLGFKTHEDTPIYLSEHLTTKGSRLYFLARDLNRSGAYKFCWTAYGKVYIRRNEQSPIVTISSEDQIHRLMSEK